MHDAFQCDFFEGGAGLKRLRPKTMDESLTFLFLPNVLEEPNKGVLQNRVSLLAG